ncbi:MAG: hypothetical protein HYX36_16535 [Rhizobiales bacterium]|nr:hypothetical protein [Hyphomicrobiales bacterium]
MAWQDAHAGFLKGSKDGISNACSSEKSFDGGMGEQINRGTETHLRISHCTDTICRALVEYRHGAGFSRVGDGRCFTVIKSVDTATDYQQFKV